MQDPVEKLCADVEAFFKGELNRSMLLASAAAAKDANRNLRDAAYALTLVHPVLRNRHIGAPGSDMRQQQIDAITAEDSLLELLGKK